jgi:hypothetical protein
MLARNKEKIADLRENLLVKSCHQADEGARVVFDGIANNTKNVVNIVAIDAQNKNYEKMIENIDKRFMEEINAKGKQLEEMLNTNLNV